MIQPMSEGANDNLKKIEDKWDFVEDEVNLTDGLLAAIEAIHSEEDIATTLRTIVERAKDIFDGIAAALFLKDPGDDFFRVVEALGYEEFEPDVSTVRFSTEDGLVGYSAKCKKTVAVPNVDEDDRYFRLFDKVRSSILTPIMIDGECRGVLQIDSDYAGTFGSDKRGTIRIVEAFAKQIAVAVHRAEEAKLRAEIQQVVLRTTQLVTVSQIASGLAHELKNGLAIVDGYARSIERDPAIKGKRGNVKNLSMMREKASDLFDLAKRLMDMSRAGEPNRRVVYLNDVISKTMVLLKPIIESRGMVVVTRLDHSLSRPKSGLGTPIEADDKQIAQVLTNLVLNAIDVSNGGQRIEVSTKKASSERVEFSVHDFGSGIKPEHSTRIFEIFFTTKPNGFGVGLYVARLLVRQHGGDISFNTKRTLGTTFKVWLPQ